MLTKPQETSQGSVKEHRNDTERSFRIIGRTRNTARRSALDLLRRIGAGRTLESETCRLGERVVRPWCVQMS